MQSLCVCETERERDCVGVWVLKRVSMTSSDISLLHQALNKQLIYSHVILQFIFQLTLSLCSSGSRGMAEARPLMALTNGTLDFNWTLPARELPWLHAHKWPREPSVIWWAHGSRKTDMGSLLTSVRNLEPGFLFPARSLCREFWGNTAFKFRCGFEGHIGLERLWFRNLS